MIELLLGLGSAAGGWLAKYLIDRRKASGQVAVTDAEKLWQEQRDFRDQIRSEMERRVAECKEEMRSIQLQNLELRIENHELRGDNLKLQFLTHPDIPEEVRNEFLEHQLAHVAKLKSALADAVALHTEPAGA